MIESRTAPQRLNHKTSSEGRIGKELAYCPNCYTAIPVSAVACEACGADLKDWYSQSYAERLIHALEHPLDDVRMRAIIALGWRREEKAERALVECALRHPTESLRGWRS
jgi:HEAT repeat protein